MIIPPLPYNFVINQGATFNPVITWKDEEGTPINLTGYTAIMQARQTINSTDEFFTLTTENGGITLGGNNGTISLYISDEDTAALTTNGIYDLFLISAGNIATMLLQGALFINLRVTNDV